MSDRGVRWLAALEGGCKTAAYLDSRGIPTISVGLTTLGEGKAERRVTLADRFADLGAAMGAFRARLRRDEVGIDAATRDDIDQQTFDAFVSARFNIGSGFDFSECLKLFNARKDAGKVADSLVRNWTRAGGDRFALQSRREAEADLILHGVYRDQGGREVR